jgi:uncharacterized membrane protein YbhN (UPF0104 family)
MALLWLSARSYWTESAAWRVGVWLRMNTVVSLFAGLMPIPGGIDVTEAGITLGLTTVGVSPETAFAAALAYRFASFYCRRSGGGSAIAG